jgi:hypothetical protein
LPKSTKELRLVQPENEPTTEAVSGKAIEISEVQFEKAPVDMLTPPSIVTEVRVALSLKA